ncbi:MAG: hypothetical protein IT329_09710 [Caldilineaceae bacterium]|nr:hypothetical protein [Caldilineaceae bacterium]
MTLRAIDRQRGRGLLAAALLASMLLLLTSCGGSAARDLGPAGQDAVPSLPPTATPAAHTPKAPEDILPTVTPATISTAIPAAIPTVILVTPQGTAETAHSSQTVTAAHAVSDASHLPEAAPAAHATADAGQLPAAHTPETAAVSHAPATAVSVTVPAAAPAGPVIVVVDAALEHQRMDGFGAGHTSLVYAGTLGDVLNPDLRRQAIAAVYGQVGLHIGNLEAALLESPGGWEALANDNDDPTRINWAGFDTSSIDAMKSAVVDLAQPYGFDGYCLAQKVNIRWASPWLKELRTANYPRYLAEVAEQVTAGAVYWRDTYGIVPRYLMLFNEPLSGNGELDGGTTQEVVDIIKAAGSRLRAAGFGEMTFVAPNEETERQTLETTRAILADAEARPYVGVIGYHTYPYGSTYADINRILATSGSGRPDAQALAVRDELAALAQQAGLPLWMTEVSHGAVDPLSFDALRGRAIHIHDELVYAGASGYFGMFSMWDRASQREHFGNDDLGQIEGHIALIDNASSTVAITGMGYAIGHYARWIGAGAVRVEATSSDPLLLVTAFHDKQAGRVALVLINNAQNGRTVEVKLQGLTPGDTITGEQSTADRPWQPLVLAGAAAGEGWTLTVPAASVTTLAASTDSAAAAN